MARHDWTGQTFGGVLVVGWNAEDPDKWDLHWLCCNRIEIATHARTRGVWRNPPKQCAACRAKSLLEDRRKRQAKEYRDKRNAERRACDAQLREARAARKAEAEAEAHRAAQDPAKGLWWGPALGKMGGRYD
jgi:hypothetical protein